MTDGIERFEALPAQTLHVPLVASYIHCLHHPSQRTRPQITRLPFGASAFHLQSVFNLTSSAFSGRRQALPPTSSPRALSHSYSGYAGSRTWERHRYRNDWWLRVVVAATATHSAVVLLVVAGNRGHQPCKGRVQLLASRIRKLNLRASYPHDDVTTDGATSQLCVDCVSPCIDAPCIRRPRSTPPSPVYARVYAREAATSTRFCAHTYSPLLALLYFTTTRTTAQCAASRPKAERVPMLTASDRQRRASPHPSRSARPFLFRSATNGALQASRPPGSSRASFPSCPVGRITPSVPALPCLAF